MPAAAVIPALIAYIKVAAVKTLVVGFRGGGGLRPARGGASRRACGRAAYKPLLFLIPDARGARARARVLRERAGSVTLSKLECSKQALEP